MSSSRAKGLMPGPGTGPRPGGWETLAYSVSDRVSSLWLRPKPNFSQNSSVPTPRRWERKSLLYQRHCSVSSLPKRSNSENAILVLYLRLCFVSFRFTSVHFVLFRSVSVRFDSGVVWSSRQRLSTGDCLHVELSQESKVFGFIVLWTLVPVQGTVCWSRKRTYPSDLRTCEMLNGS